jgi:hypothetical protein
MMQRRFAGIVPRVPEHMLGDGAAVIAHDVDLSHGTIKAWREPLTVKQLPGTTLTLEVYGCCYFGWDTCVSVARWLPDCPRLYITGHAAYPEVAAVNFSECTLDYARLGIPAPGTAPILSYIEPGDKTVESSSRAYVYTFVNWLDEEGAPSYPSTDMVCNDGDQVIVSGFDVPAPEYRVEKVRVYRRVTGFRDGREKEQEPATEWLLVGETAVGSAAFIDTKKDRYLGTALSTREVREPPADLQQIVAISDTAILCGFAGNKLYFTKPRQPWNWPLELEVTLDDNIVHIAEVDGSVFVSTTGRPYMVAGDAGCDDRPCREVVKMDYPFEDIGCGYAHSAIGTPFGMVFAGKDGLVLVNRSEQPTIITNQFFAADDWRALAPDTVRLAYHDGYLICVTDRISFRLLLDHKTYQAEAQNALLTTISDEPVDMVLSDSGELLMLQDGYVKQWNAGVRLRPYHYVTAPLMTGYQAWMPAAEVNLLSGETTFSLVAENRTMFSRPVALNRPFRTARLNRNRKYYVDFTGTGEVSFYRVGQTNVDMGNN